MAEVLNMVPKKDVFEGIISGQRTDIPIKKNDWWKKRLIDQDTGRFKDFAVVCISCGSSDKYYYAIQSMELKDDLFIITISQDLNNLDSGDSDIDIYEESALEVEEENVDGENKEDIIGPETIEPVQINPVVVDTVNNVVIIDKKYTIPPEAREAIIKRFITKFNVEQKEDVSDIKDETMKLINSFCTQKDVFVVNMPFVTIRNNGQIIGYHGGRRLVADRDSDVRIDFKKFELQKYAEVSDAEFLMTVNKFLDNLLKGSYVFINQKYCGFETTHTGELILKIAAVAKKKYLFRK